MGAIFLFAGWFGDRRHNETKTDITNMTFYDLIALKDMTKHDFFGIFSTRQFDDSGINNKAATSSYPIGESYEHRPPS